MQTLVTQRRHRPVPGNKLHIVAQRQQLTLNRVNQLRVVAAREITAPYATFKQDVT